MKGLTDYFVPPYVMVSPLPRDECVERLKEKLKRPKNFLSRMKRQFFSDWGYVDRLGLHIFARDGTEFAFRNFNSKIVVAGDHTKLICNSVIAVRAIFFHCSLIAMCGYFVTISGQPLTLGCDSLLNLSMLFLAFSIFLLFAYFYFVRMIDRRNMRFLESTVYARKARKQDAIALGV